MKTKTYLTILGYLWLTLWLPQQGWSQFDYCALFGSPFGCITNVSPAYGRPGTTFQVTLTGFGYTTCSPTCAVEIGGLQVTDTMIVMDGVVKGTLSIPAMQTAGNVGAKIFVRNGAGCNISTCTANFTSCTNCFKICGPCDNACTLKEKLDNNLATVAELLACGVDPCDLKTEGILLTELLSSGASVAALLGCYPACEIYATDPSTLNSLLAAGVPFSDITSTCFPAMLKNPADIPVTANGLSCSCPLLVLNNIGANGTRIDDPCNCNDPLNVPGNAAGYLFHDVLTIATYPNMQIAVAMSSGFLDANGVAIPDNTVLGMTNGSGILTYDFWHLSNVQATATFTTINNGSTIGSFSSDICDAAACNPIPTLSEWGLSILTLLILIAGTVMLKAPAEIKL